MPTFSDLSLSIVPRQFTISASRAKRITDALSRTGLNVTTLCALAQLDMAKLADQQARFPVETVRRLWEAAVTVSGNDAIGLLASRLCVPHGLDVLEYSMMTSATLGAALERAFRYARIIDDATEYRHHRNAQGWSITFDFVMGSRPAPRQSFEFVMLSLLRFCRWMVGTNLLPVEVTFTHPLPASLYPYREAFGCPLRFGAAANSIVIADSDLALELPTRNANLSRILDRCADEQVEALKRGNLSGRVCRWIQRELAGGGLGRDRVARALGLSERTLHRRLREEGTTFQQLLDETRRELAQQYLSSQSITLAEACYLLGFANQSNFSRASKRWFALPPQKMREDMASAVGTKP